MNFYELHNRILAESHSEYTDTWAMLHYLDTYKLMDLLPRNLGDKVFNFLLDKYPEEVVRRKMIDYIMDQKFGTAIPKPKVPSRTAGLNPSGRLPSDYGDQSYPTDVPNQISGPGAYYSGMMGRTDPVVHRGLRIAGGE